MSVKKYLIIIVLLIFHNNARAQSWQVYADSAKSLEKQRRPDSAIVLLKLSRQILGKDSMETLSYGRIAYALGRMYFWISEFGIAEENYLQAKKIFEDKLGKNQMEYALLCKDLGANYMNRGSYGNAENLFIESQQVILGLVGRDSKEYAASSAYLGMINADLAKYEKAEKYFLENRQISAKLFGKESYNYISSCRNLGILYTDMGKLDEAEQVLIECNQLSLTIFGKEHLNYGLSCDNLGNLYRVLGQFRKAEPLYLIYHQIVQKNLGKDHFQFGQSCGNLANLYSDFGQNSKAEVYYQQHLKIAGNVFGKDNPEYASVCYNLGMFYIDINQFNKAETFLLSSKEIYEKTLGKAHPAYGDACFGLAELYRRKGKSGKARPLYSEALVISEKTFGSEHSDYVTKNRGLASFYWSNGNLDSASEVYKVALLSRKVINKRIFRFTNEHEKQIYLRADQYFNNEFFSFALSANQLAAASAFDLSLHSRNLILYSGRQLRKSFYELKDTSSIRIYNNWLEIRKELATLLTKPIEERINNIAETEEKADSLEKILTRVSAVFEKEERKTGISWESIQQSLNKEEAAIEFIEFPYFDGNRWTDSIYYCALLLRKDRQEPELIKLFERKELLKILKYNSTSPSRQQLSNIYTINRTNNGASLFNLVWKPLEGKLNGIHTIYFAQAGLLHKIAFSAIPISVSQFLGDIYRLVSVSTTATLLDRSEKNILPGEEIQLYGGIQYDADSNSITNEAKRYEKNMDEKTLTVSRVGNWQFPPLTGTAIEIEGIAESGRKEGMKVVTFNGIKGTEESFKSNAGKKSPVVIHIATHGYFFPDPQNKARDTRILGSDVFKQSDNPLIRSGLALAGANNTWKGKPITGVEDGILTAYEVSNMYLPNTKLAVLSACETGLGDIQGSEGVYGLQRAFKMAGVQNLVMSLWKVPDAETAEFMQEFYKNLFAKQTINDAFYNAQTILKNKYRNDPYNWAAWVLVR